MTKFSFQMRHDTVKPIVNGHTIESNLVCFRQLHYCSSTQYTGEGHTKFSDQHAVQQGSLRAVRLVYPGALFGGPRGLAGPLWRSCALSTG
jgi:hypothetical protein